MNDLRTFILDLAERKPDMRVKSLANEIKKFDCTKRLEQERLVRSNAQAHHQREPFINKRVSPDRRNWLERFASYFSARGY